MKSTKEDLEKSKLTKTKNNTKLVGKEAIVKKQDNTIENDLKSLKDVFIDESTKTRLRINIIERELSDLKDIVSKIRARLGI